MVVVSPAASPATQSLQMASSSRFLFTNGVVLRAGDAPPVASFLETQPGAYTTSRTHNNASCLLFWPRHLQRLADSARILFDSNPKLLFKSLDPPPPFSSLLSDSSFWESEVPDLVNDSVNKVLPIAIKERSGDEELAITALVSGDLGKLGVEGFDEKRVSEILEVHVHIGAYASPVGGNGARLAVVGRGRVYAGAKYSNWVRLRKPLEKLRPPSVTELLLSNDGDRILEGTLTNFFVVCCKDKDEAKGEYMHSYGSTCSLEVLTAPLGDGVLPGVVRQLVIEICLSIGIPVREVAPSWSDRQIWQEAFITNSLRLIQHVESVKAPSSWESIASESWKDVSWKEKRFEEGPGMITKLIQKEMMERASLEGYPISPMLQQVD